MPEGQTVVSSEQLRDTPGLVEAALENARSLISNFTPH